MIRIDVEIFGPDPMQDVSAIEIEYIPDNPHLAFLPLAFCARNIKNKNGKLRWYLYYKKKDLAEMKMRAGVEP